MADAVTTQTLHDGGKNLVVKLTNISDGTGESAVKKVDVSGLSPVATGVVIQKIHYITEGMSVQLYWDATTDVLIMSLRENSERTFDFSEFGGLVNTKASGYTGDINLTTTGHTSGDKYTIILEMKKQY